jgi:hypothetical protein
MKTLSLTCVTGEGCPSRVLRLPLDDALIAQSS